MDHDEIPRVVFNECAHSGRTPGSGIGLNTCDTRDEEKYAHWPVPAGDLEAPDLSRQGQVGPGSP